MKRLANLFLLLMLLPIATVAKKKITTPDVPARLHWIGQVPAADKPVSFGIPFLKGEMRPTDVFQLTTDKGEVIPADFWPTAYWPDGSVKWGGFAAVVPGGTESISLSSPYSPSPDPSPVREGRPAASKSNLSPPSLTGEGSGEGL